MFFVKPPAPDYNPEVLHGVCADGVGVKFPIFAVNFAVVCPCPLGDFSKAKQSKKKLKNALKKRKCVKKRGKSLRPHDGIYTNPTKNLPI